MSRRKKVTIVGAGMAGLTAARELHETGHDVIVFERQHRVGGRAVSIRGVFADHLIGQAGPSRFPSGFKRVLDLARKLNLDIRPYYPDRGRVMARLKGRLIEDYQPNAEEFWGYVPLVNRYPSRAERLSVRIRLTLRKFARRALGRPPWMTYRILEGTDRLAEKLAAVFGAELRLGHTVLAIKQRNNQVLIEYLSPDGLRTHECDFAVCAVPLSVLNDIAFEPALTPAKRELANQVPFSSALRVFLQFQHPFWRNQGKNGFAVTDTVGEVWDPEFDRNKSPAMLVCYAKYDLADRLASMSGSELIGYILSELERIFPGAQDHFERWERFCWREQPWVKGGWPLLRGFVSRVNEFRKPEQRVFFAGDYVASARWLNTMEGAIESGQHVAKQLSSLT